MLKYIPLFIHHLFESEDPASSWSDNWNKTDHSKLCLETVPCFTLYSSFEQRLGLAYSVTLAFFIFIGFAAILYELVRFDYKALKLKEIKQASYFPVSSTLFGLWQWHIDRPRKMKFWVSKGLSTI